MKIQLGVPSGYTGRTNGFKPISIYLTTDASDAVGEYSVTSAGEGVVAAVNVTKATYGSGLPEKCIIIVASYSADKELVAHTFEEKILSKGDNLLTLTLDNTNGGTTQKVFVWNSFASLTPLK